MRADEWTGKTLPTTWLWAATVPAQSAIRDCDNVPNAGGSGYTHTLVFPILGTGEMMLGLKLKGFAAGSINGFGGKIESTDATTIHAALRELHEETALQLSPPDLLFAGRVNVHVQNGEMVTIAVFTTSPIDPHTNEGTLKQVTLEIRPFTVPRMTTHSPVEYEDLPDWARGASLRPEHILYLPTLLAQTNAGSVFDVSVNFDPEPERAAVSTGQRPENQRTVHAWNLTLYNSTL